MTLSFIIVFFCFVFFFSRTVGTLTEAASTSDSSMDRGLARLRESSQESGPSGSRLDLPSQRLPGPSEKSRTSESDGDDQDNAEDGSQDGISDHDATENGHVEGINSRDIGVNDSKDEISEHDVKENGGPNGIEMSKEGEETIDIRQKNRKTKKSLEVNSVSLISPPLFQCRYWYC